MVNKSFDQKDTLLNYRKGLRHTLLKNRYNLLSKGIKLMLG
jgi:hypothetical protein